MHLWWRRQQQPTPVLLPGKSHGQRSLVGCSPWGYEESDTTERLHFHFHNASLGKVVWNSLKRPWSMWGYGDITVCLAANPISVYSPAGTSNSIGTQEGILPSSFNDKSKTKHKNIKKHRLDICILSSSYSSTPLLQVFLMWTREMWKSVFLWLLSTYTSFLYLVPFIFSNSLLEYQKKLKDAYSLEEKLWPT